MPENILFKQARLLDPATGTDQFGDLLVVDGHIAGAAEKTPPGCRTLDAQGGLITPGLIDLHTHLREPGGEDAETIASGTLAARRGGFTTVVAMPNTAPPTDRAGRLQWVIERARATARCNVLPTGCLSHERKGQTLADIVGMAAAGVAALTDDGATPADPQLMREACALAANVKLPVLDHAHDPALEKRGVMHAGAAATRFNLPGIPAQAESDIVARDIALARETGARVHLQHLSCAASVSLLAEAQARRLKITGELTPHHLVFCDEEVDPANPDFKMNPPLRSRADRDALREALRNKTITIFATDHAPHTAQAKQAGFLRAPFGVVGLETAAAATWTYAVKTGLLSERDWLRCWTTGPAAVLQLPPPTLRPGAIANLMLFDPEETWVVDPAQFASRSRNTPFANMTLTGRVRGSMYRGAWLSF